MISTAVLKSGISEEELLRARFYSLLSRLLAAPASAKTLAFLRDLEGDATPIGSALEDLASATVTVTQEAAEEEYNVLFQGSGAGGELSPYASHYLTGFVYEKPLASLRADMKLLGIARTGALCEPEDHIATLCEIMHGLIHGLFDGDSLLEVQKKFFHDHMQAWASQFFTDLEEADSATLYKPIGSIGREFMLIEAKAFEMVA